MPMELITTLASIRNLIAFIFPTRRYAYSATDRRLHTAWFSQDRMYHSSSSYISFYAITEKDAWTGIHPIQFVYARHS